MVRTPWGDSEGLREQRLSPGPGTPAEEVERSQRERLFGAMVAVATTKGYAATTVADLLAVSGVSRRAFYRHFADKEDCFLATLEEVVGAVQALTAGLLYHDGPLEERLPQTLRAIVELVIAQPAAARLGLIEAYAAGPRSIARMDDALAALQRITGGALEGFPDRGGMPAEMVEAMVGGFRKIVYTRLNRGAEQELLEMTPGLAQVALRYAPPPGPLRRPRRGGGDRRARDGEALDPASHDNSAERLIRATTSVMAQRGYQGARIGDIVAAGRVSLSTFYEHFDGKLGAFEAAIDSGQARMLGVALPTFRRARDWPTAVRSTLEAILDFLAAERDFARLATLEVYATGPATLERLDNTFRGLEMMLEPGFEHAPELPELTPESIVAALFAMVREQVRRRGPEALPELAPLATHMTLVPFLGPEAAYEVARGGAAPS